MTIIIGSHVIHLSTLDVQRGLVVEAWELCVVALIWRYRHLRKKAGRL